MYEETIDLAHLPPDGLRVERRVHANAWKIEETDWHSRGELHFEVLISGNTRKAFVYGSFEAGITAECHRCLNDVDLGLSRNFNITYVLADAEQMNKEEMELDNSELEMSYLDSPYVPLHEMIREQVYLVLPMKFLCSAECHGLCPHCGGNLNEVKCACTGEPADSRWESLKAIVHEEK